MKKVAKAVMIDPDGQYLLMVRSDHHTFGRDADLPGGKLEEGETLLEGMVREVKEEIGVDIDSDDAEQIYEGGDYSAYGTHYALFVVKLGERPNITISWEHSAYDWLSREEFLKRAETANDGYMHMVHDVAGKY